MININIYDRTVTDDYGNQTSIYRHLMQQKLGRKLTSDEIVHHINGDHCDNRIENLQVVTKEEHRELHKGQNKAGCVSINKKNEKYKNAALGINYHKELDKDMIEWFKKQRNYSGIIRQLMYDYYEGKTDAQPVVKEEVKLNKSILTSIDNM